MTAITDAARAVRRYHIAHAIKHGSFPAWPDAPIHEERQMNKDGPVMPRVPSDDLLRRYTSHKINPVEARAIYSCIRDYLSFREKVEQAQNTSSGQGGRYDQAEDALYLTKVVRSGPEPIESPWAEDE